MAEFDKAIGTVLKNEGGYVCDPADPGGETNYGICKRDHPEVDIKALTREGAIEIYRRRYWQPHFDQIQDQALATELLDACVNQGPGPAISALQRAINDLGGHCAVDGVFGAATVSLANRLDHTALLIDYKAEQALHYVDIAESKPTLKKYLKGWLIRAIASVMLALLLATPAAAFLAPGPENELVQEMIRTEILPRFAACPGLVYGIESVDTFEDQDHPAIRYWTFTIVETVRARRPGSAEMELVLIEETLTFRAMPGLAPRLIEVSQPVPWP